MDFCFFSFIFLAVSFLFKLKEYPQIEMRNVYYYFLKHSKLGIISATFFPEIGEKEKNNNIIWNNVKNSEWLRKNSCLANVLSS